MTFLSPLLAATLSAASLSQAEPVPSLAQQAVQAFETVCLASRVGGADAALGAVRSYPGVVERPELPLGNKRLKVFASGPIEFLVREDRRGFGCFVAFEGGGARAQEAVTALSAIEGLTPRQPRHNRRPSHEWDIAGSRDHVRLVPDSDLGGVLINLEARTGQ